MIKSIRAKLRLASTPQGQMAWTAFGVSSPRMIFSQRLAVIALFFGLALAQTSAAAAGENLFNVADLDQPPIARAQADPAYPYEMARAGISGWTIVEFVVNANGDVQSIRPIKSTHRNFEEAACKAVLKWKFKTGIKNGQPVNTRISLKFDFSVKGNHESVVKTPYSVKEVSEARTLLQQGEKESANAPPAAEPLVADEGAAYLTHWVQPEYPATAQKAKKEGRVTVHFVVEADGSVTRASVAKSSDPQFDAAALAAVQRWKFNPALSEGRPVASAMRVPVVFRLDQLKQKRVPLQPSQTEMPAPLPRTKAKMKTSPNPDYPQELADRQLSGQVDLEFTVGDDGIARAPKILWASHPAFVGAALQALGRCEFEPAHQGPLVQTQVLRAPMEFASLGIDRAAVLAANRITVPLKDSLDVLPSPLVMIEPVHPLERLLAAETGSATVEFAVNERGHVGSVVLVSATQPDFGAALVAAVEAWLFNPGLKGGQTVATSLRVTHEFAPPAGGATGRLVTALQPGGAGIGGAGGLDRKLAPLWRGFPVYPAGLKEERPSGKAQIEFIIDQEGRARLPRVVSASHESFGWAAATAISQWVFEPPVRGGQPVDVRVSIPVAFAPPKE